MEKLKNAGEYRVDKWLTYRGSDRFCHVIGFILLCLAFVVE